MLRFMKFLMRVIAVGIGALLTYCLHNLMPRTSLPMAWLCFIALCVVLLFALSLVLASFVIGSAPKRSAFGDLLRRKVDEQERAGYDVAKAARQRAKANQGTGQPPTV